MDMLRQNPRKLNMPLLKETAKVGGGVGTLAFLNTTVIPKIGVQNALILLGVEYGLAVMLSNKYPLASAGMQGGLLGALISAGAAYITNDIGLIAWNPKMERQLKGTEYAGLPENLAIALGT